MVSDKISFQKSEYACANETENESANNEGIRFDKVLFKTIGGILFLKVIHNSSKDDRGIDDIDTGDKQIEPLRGARHGKSIICILPY